MLLEAAQVNGWQGPERCDNSGPNCLEMAEHNGVVAIRSSADPAGMAITADHGEVSAFLEAVKRGEFDKFASA